MQSCCLIVIYDDENVSGVRVEKPCTHLRLVHIATNRGLKIMREINHEQRGLSVRAMNFDLAGDFASISSSERELFSYSHYAGTKQ